MLLDGYRGWVWGALGVLTALTLLLSWMKRMMMRGMYQGPRPGERSALRGPSDPPKLPPASAAALLRAVADAAKTSPETKDPKSFDARVTLESGEDGVTVHVDAASAVSTEAASPLEPVVFLHGGPATPFSAPHRRLLANLSDLGREMTFVYPHQRGAGLSSRPIQDFGDRTGGRYYSANAKKLEGTLGLRAQIRDIERVTAALSTSGSGQKTKEKPIIFGHSFGGFIASLTAAERPDMPRALVLLCPAACLVPDRSTDLFANTRAALGAEHTEAFRTWQGEYMDFSPRLFSRDERKCAELHAAFYPFWTAAFGDTSDGARAVAESGGRLDPSFVGGWSVFAQYMSMGAERDLRPSLKNVTCPVLVIHGAKDVQPVSVAEEYRDSFGGAAEVVTMDKVGHFPFDEDPDELARIVADFLKRHDL